MSAERVTSDALALAREVLPRMIQWRRQIHANPELAMEEFATSALVQEVLQDLGIEVYAGPEHTGTPTGVVGLLRGTAPRPNGEERTIGIRADMDALPIQEQTGLPFASRNPGKMHACGHDGHTAILLGTAAILAGMREQLPGNVKFFFQPAEEDEGGAEPMIRAGCMENPRVDAVIALHLSTVLPTGKISVTYGVSTAAADTARITVRGRAAHGAWPHRGVDAVLAAAHVVVALQALVSRETPPLDAVVLTVGTIHGGTANNIVCDEVTMEATVRTLKRELREAMPDRIRRVVESTAAAYGAQAEVEYIWGYPSLHNDQNITALVEAVGRDLLGDDGVTVRSEPGMGAEDFAYFAEAAPGCMFSLGARNEALGIVHEGHTPYYTFDEEAMAVGAAVFVETVRRFLAGKA